MRKLIVVSLAALLVSLGIPAAAQAQTPVRLASVAGQVVDASGRGAIGQRVELVQNGVIVQTTSTTARGSFAFASVAAGDYVVRTNVNNTPAGIRVSLAAGMNAANATIVLPSSAAPSGALLGPLVGLFGAVGTGFIIGGIAIATAAIIKHNIS